MSKKNILMAIDIGSDSTKIIVNKKVYRFPSDVMTTPDKLCSMEFRTYLITVIAYAIVKYSMEEDVNLEPANTDDYDIFIALALPHDCYLKGSEFVKRFLTNTHDFDLVVCKKAYHVNFKIEEEKFLCYSQTLCLWFNEVLDENGIEVQEHNELYKRLPVLLLDGGYSTFDIVQIEEGYSIAPENQESNGDFTIQNLKDLEKTTIDNMSEKLISYLCKKFHNLLHVEQIIIGGGAGFLYADKLKPFCEKKRLVDVVVANNIFSGEEVAPIFAVATGLYKYALSEFKKTSNFVNTGTKTKM